MKKEHKWLIGGLVMGALVAHFTAFMLIYENQPHDFNCNRAQTECDLFGYTDNTPYADCDSCCPDEPTDTCSGVRTPYYSTSEQSQATQYCSAFGCPIGKECVATWHSDIAMMAWECGCATPR